MEVIQTSPEQHYKEHEGTDTNDVFSSAPFGTWSAWRFCWKNRGVWKRWKVYRHIPFGTVMPNRAPFPGSLVSVIVVPVR